MLDNGDPMLALVEYGRISYLTLDLWKHINFKFFKFFHETLYWFGLGVNSSGSAVTLFNCNFSVNYCNYV